MTENNSKPRLLFFYDYFFPAYKAGGPIQSLTNLILTLQHEYDIAVVTGGYDLGDDQLLANVKVNVWSEIMLPGASAKIKVWYAGSHQPGITTIKNAIKIIDPSCVYLNGMFSLKFVIIPLLVIKKVKLVICPRGMLQLGALAGKPLKKKIFLAVLKISGLLKRVIWHATNALEKDDIYREFGNSAKVLVAGNIPRKPMQIITPLKKNTGQLDLVYLSLISEKKNLLQLINIISKTNDNTTLHIYGPVKDEGYFKKCTEAINNSNGKISYKGDVLPEKVQNIFTAYHASILLTKGENFGHALYESLSASRPVITSNFTPWNQLQEKKAGWNVDLNDETGITKLINHLCYTDQAEYELYYKGAYNLANEYFKNGFNTTAYKELFL